MPDQPDKVDLETLDLAAAKRAAFDDLFPGVIADGVLDATRLGELLDTDVTAPAEGRERFGLMWAGKKDSVRALLAPSRGALVPEFDKSINFDSARNVFVEGDNLETLKLLQKAYNDQVKMIYIDPPYNAKAQVPYLDDYVDSLASYLRFSGQVDDDGNRRNAGLETAGRLHSRWLSMMYPRLVLARNLLTQDGVLLCSINDMEFANLVSVLTEIFGEENFVANFVWNNDGNIEQQSNLKVNHEFIVAFARDAKNLPKPAVIDPNISEGSKLFNNQIENSITKNGPANPPSVVLLPKGFPASTIAFDVAPRQDAFPHVLDPIVVRDGVLTKPARLRSGWSSRRLLDLFIENRFVPIEDAEGKESRFDITPSGALYLYKRRSEAQGHVLTVLRNMGTTKATSSWLLKYWGIPFSYPKPERLIQHLVATFSSNDDLVMDFFAGSGTTAHAVALQNAADKGQRRCLSVNIPEQTEIGSAASAAGFQYVSEMTRLRLTKVANEVPGADRQGLRSFKLKASNFVGETTPDQDGLLDLRESTLKTNGQFLDAVVGEILLKEGVPLDAEWLRYTAGGSPVVFAEGVAVMMTLEITEEAAAEALALAPSVLIFLEDGFAGRDSVKANAFTNARSLGITMKTV
jgi:adenine-specific DNA-methyltransferase